MTLEELQLRDQKLSQRSDNLISVIAEFGLTLPKNAIEWRVCGTKSPDGGYSRFVLGHHALHGLCKMLMTDGLVSWFLLGDGQTLFFGHLANFEPEEPPAKFFRKPKAKTKREILSDID